MISVICVFQIFHNFYFSWTSDDLNLINLDFVFVLQIPVISSLEMVLETDRILCHFGFQLFLNMTCDNE